MEQTGSEKTSVTPVGVIKVLAAVATVDVDIAIYEHWRGFDVLRKGLAGLLLANLIAWPAMAILVQEREFQMAGLASRLRMGATRYVAFRTTGLMMSFCSSNSFSSVIFQPMLILAC